MARKLQAHGRFWLTLDEINFLGHGRVELLQRIAETGSISKAAKAMDMSYSRAWQLVDAMNQSFRKPLVEGAAVFHGDFGELRVVVFAGEDGAEAGENAVAHDGWAHRSPTVVHQ